MRIFVRCKVIFEVLASIDHIAEDRLSTIMGFIKLIDAKIAQLKAFRIKCQAPTKEEWEIRRMLIPDPTQPNVILGFNCRNRDQIEKWVIFLLNFQ